MITLSAGDNDYWATGDIARGAPDKPVQAPGAYSRAVQRLFRNSSSGRY
jgi:hypothetical protein